MTPVYTVGYTVLMMNSAIERDAVAGAVTRRKETTMEATYTKLRSGDWGIRIKDINKPAPGGEVRVTKKSGESKIERISRVVWQGDGVAICAIARGGSSGSSYGSYATIGARMESRMERTGWTGCSCGSIEDHPRDSDCASCQHDY